MGPHDVYIKGVNAIDPDGNVGVLIGNTSGAGTIGRVMAASLQKTTLDGLTPSPSRDRQLPSCEDYFFHDPDLSASG